VQHGLEEAVLVVGVEAGEIERLLLLLLLRLFMLLGVRVVAVPLLRRRVALLARIALAGMTGMPRMPLVPGVHPLARWVPLPWRIPLLIAWLHLVHGLLRLGLGAAEPTLQRVEKTHLDTPQRVFVHERVS